MRERNSASYDRTRHRRLRSIGNELQSDRRSHRAIALLPRAPAAQAAWQGARGGKCLDAAETSRTSDLHISSGQLEVSCAASPSWSCSWRWCWLSPSTVVGTARAADDRVVAIVLLDAPPLASYRGGIRGLAAPVRRRDRRASTCARRRPRAYRTFSAAPRQLRVAGARGRCPTRSRSIATTSCSAASRCSVHESDLAILAALPGVRARAPRRGASLPTPN